MKEKDERGRKSTHGERERESESFGHRGVRVRVWRDVTNIRLVSEF